MAAAVNGAPRCEPGPLGAAAAVEREILLVELARAHQVFVASFAKLHEAHSYLLHYGSCVQKLQANLGIAEEQQAAPHEEPALQEHFTIHDLDDEIQPADASHDLESAFEQWPPQNLEERWEPCPADAWWASEEARRPGPHEQEGEQASRWHEEDYVATEAWCPLEDCGPQGAVGCLEPWAEPPPQALTLADLAHVAQLVGSAQGGPLRWTQAAGACLLERHGALLFDWCARRRMFSGPAHQAGCAPHLCLPLAAIVSVPDVFSNSFFFCPTSRTRMWNSFICSAIQTLHRRVQSGPSVPCSLEPPRLPTQRRRPGAEPGPPARPLQHREPLPQPSGGVPSWLLSEDAATRSKGIDDILQRTQLRRQRKSRSAERACPTFLVELAERPPPFLLAEPEKEKAGGPAGDAPKDADGTEQCGAASGGGVPVDDFDFGNKLYPAPELMDDPDDDLSDLLEEEAVCADLDQPWLEESCLAAVDVDATSACCEEEAPPPSEHWAKLEKDCQGVHCETHRAEEPRSRRCYSWGRTLSFAKVALGARGTRLRLGTRSRPFTIWVLSATEGAELFLAKEGFLHCANFLDSEPTEVVLLNSSVQPLHLAGPAAPGGHSLLKPAEVRSASYDDVRGMEPPDLVAMFMPAASSSSAIPEHVLELVSEIPTVVTLRFKPTSLDEQRLSGQMLLPVTRSPFSAAPDASPAPSAALAFDDNGWILAVQGSALAEAVSVKVPELPKPPAKAKLRKDRKPATFWGILDIKFDPSKPVLEKVKILEAGGGGTSKFSGDGKDIKERFDNLYKSEPPKEAVDMAVMHEMVSIDKKFLHDNVVGLQYEHLLPRQSCCFQGDFQKCKATVMHELGVTEEDEVVLKLCNRTRAAGVVVTPVKELEQTLADLLDIPDNVEEWLKEEAARLGKNRYDQGLQPGQRQENRRHWISNESPFFLVEECCRSMPCIKESKPYDGTMRVGFALVPQNGNCEDLRVEWLGCYWKLPKKAMTPGASLQESTVSSARTSGTMAVDPVHCAEIYASLGDLLPRLFTLQEPSFGSYWNRYAACESVAAFFKVRLAATTVHKDRNRAQCYLAEARELLLHEVNVHRKSRDILQSYICRWEGVVECSSRGRGSKSSERLFGDAQWYLPTNANLYFQLGAKHFQEDEFDAAVTCFRKCLVLDPDTRATFQWLGCCHLQLRQWQAAIDVTQAGMQRHGNNVVLRYHYGVALANLNPPSTMTFPSKELREAWAVAQDHLRAARFSQEAQKRKKPSSPFSDYDDELFNWLEERAARHDGKRPPRLPELGPMGWLGMTQRP